MLPRDFQASYLNFATKLIEDGGLSVFSPLVACIKKNILVNILLLCNSFKILLVVCLSVQNCLSLIKLKLLKLLIKNFHMYTRWNNYNITFQ